MSFKIKIGTGKGKSYVMPVGSLTAKLLQEHEKTTIKQLAMQLAKQYRIKDGEIELLDLSFTIYQVHK